MILLLAGGKTWNCNDEEYGVRIVLRQDQKSSPWQHPRAPARVLP